MTAATQMLRANLIAQAMEQVRFSHYAIVTSMQAACATAQVARAKRAVKTKLGVAIDKGDDVLIFADRDNSPGFVTVWSWRNQVRTSVPVSALKVLA